MKLSAAIFVLAGLATAPNNSAALRACEMITSKAGCKARTYGWKPSAACHWAYLSGKAACVKKGYKIQEDEMTACKLIKDKAFCKSQSGRCKYTKILGKSKCVNDKSYADPAVGVPDGIPAPPAPERVPCSEIDSYRQLANRQKYCLRRGDCQFVNKRCLDLGTTKSPTMPAPTSSPTLKTGGAPCSEIDGYKLVNRQKYCNLRADCTLTSGNRCVDAGATDAPTAAALPTDAPTSAATDSPTSSPTLKTGGAPCSEIDGYKLVNRKKYCNLRADCTLTVGNRCVDAGATDAPTAAALPTDAPTTVAISKPNCAQYSVDFKDDCLATEGCEWNLVKPMKKCTNARTTKEFCNQFHKMEAKCVAYGCDYKINTNCGCGGAYC